MGKNYAESSLKRFLKKRVRITLGLVVTFLITGMTVFAEGKEVVQKDHKNEWEWEQVKEAEKYLVSDKVSLKEIEANSGTNERYFRKENGKDTYKIKMEGLIADKKDEISFEIKDPQNLTDITKTNLNNSFTLLDNLLNKNKLEEISELGEEYNKAIGLDHTAKSIYKAENGEVAVAGTDVKEEEEVQTADNGIIINKGILLKGQKGSNNSEVYNFSLLSGNQTADNSKGYNYGIINGTSGGQKATGNGIIYNYGVINTATFSSFGQQTANEAYNHGVIAYVGAYSTTIGQQAENKAKVYNYGLIRTGGASQGTNKNNAELYNYGNIEYMSAKGLLNSGTYYGAQVIYGGLENRGYNYGIIDNYANKNNTLGTGQGVTASEDNRMYNFGVINSNAIGQYIYTATQGKESPAVHNYGTINITKDTINNTTIEKGQYIKGYINEENSLITNNKAYNYGTILVSDDGVGQYLEKSGDIYNFGTIKNNGTGYAMELADVNDEENYKAVNYGIINAENGKSFKGDITNRGFVITKDGTVDSNAWTGINQGIVLDEKLELAQGSTGAGQINENVIDLSKETGKITLTDEKVMAGDKDLSGTDKQTTVFMKNQNAELIGEKYDGKNINIVIDDNYNSDSKALVEANIGSDKELELTNTTIAGYFAGTKGGTVLAVDSDLTLVGDSVISAIKGENVTEDVYALSIEKNAMLTFVGENIQINGMIDGEEGGITAVASKKFETVGEIGVLKLRNASENMITAGGVAEDKNFTDIELGKSEKPLTIGELQLSFDKTTEGETNKVVLGENVVIKNGINGTESEAGNKLDLEISNISNIEGGIKLGASDDTITTKNDPTHKGVIDMGTGDDVLNIKVNHDEGVVNGMVFNHEVKNAEEINLTGGRWYVRDGKLSFDNNNGKTNNKVDLNVKDGALWIAMDNNTGKLTTELDNLVDKGTDLTISAKGGIKYTISNNFKVGAGEQYVIDTNYKLGDYTVEVKGENDQVTEEQKPTKVTSASIFNTKVDDKGDVVLTVKTAEEVTGVAGKYDSIYKVLLENLHKNSNLLYRVNNHNNLDEHYGFGTYIKNLETTSKAYYTSGYIVTKNIADTYSSISEDLNRKAEKGQWLAQGKYINSDTEFDGGKEVKGYDGDITGTVGMIEYGVSEQASYGAIFGKGDTKVNIDGGSDLEGDNFYVGAFVKYRTLNGIDLVGNLGFVKSELDSKLSNEITFADKVDSNVSGEVVDYHDGTADSKAITLSLTGKKDFYISDSVRLQPKAGIRYNFIQQDEAKNEGMNFRIAAQDVTIIEGLAGMGIAKDIELNNGKLSLNAGLEYTLSNASQYDEMEYTLEGTPLDLETSEIADSRGLGYIGADYEHENGVGFNVKYEMIWSDTGDDSRITAGVSYRF